MAITETKKTVKKEEKASPRVARAVSKSSSELKGFAIIETGGKQYRVSSGDVLLVEKLSDTHKRGDAISFDKVLLSYDGAKLTLGDPYIKDMEVRAVFEERTRGKKIDVLKFKSKSRWTRRYGHRQTYAKIKIL